MNNLLSKLNFFWKKSKVVIVAGKARDCAAEAIFQVLKQNFLVGKEVFIFKSEPDKSGVEKFRYLLKHSSLPILVVTHIGDIPFVNQEKKDLSENESGLESREDSFAGESEDAKEIRELAEMMPASSSLILNFDDETVREIKDGNNLPAITFGFQARADLRATDVRLNGGTNFKINHRGNVVPMWLDKLFGKEQIYSALASAAVGLVLGLNLVEISQALKNYQSLPGKMRLIGGIKNSWILDDTESATAFSMIEAIRILGKVQPGQGKIYPGNIRRVAVLGDVIGIGKYTIEAHETIGEEVGRNADLLFTFGSRAKFIAQGAMRQGMAIEKIFQFDTIEQGKSKLEDEIKEGDLILVDGSKEIKMAKIVEEIKGPIV